MGGCRHSEESKQKMRKPKSPEHIANLKGKNLGRIHTLEQNQNHSKKISGEKHPFFGKPRSEETKEKIRISNLGLKRTEEVKQKMSGIKRGKLLSEDHKKNISNSGKGLKRTDETKERIRLSKLGNKNSLGNHHSKETKEKIGLKHKGKILSEESREKISKSLMGHIPWNKGKHNSN